MAGIKRLTYYFYAYRQDEDNRIFLRTTFPFIADQTLLINRPVGRTDVAAVAGFDANPTLEELPNLIKISNYGSYSSQSWFIGLAVNGVVIYDGVFLKPNGITAEISNLFSPMQGIVTIDTDVFTQEFGILDNLEIVIISAQTWTPWLYYGYRYTDDADDDLAFKRAFLLRNIDNGSWRTPINMGGIFDSLLPAQAIQMKTFVNVNLSELFVPLIIPFPSAFFLGTQGSTSSSNNVYHTADVIDGNGELKLRSSVKFNISSQSLTGGIAGATFNLRTVIRADAYRTLNSRKMEYIDTTYSEKKLLKNARYYVCFEKNKKYKNIYMEIANSFLFIVDNFVNKENDTSAEFVFIGYDKSSIETLYSSTSDLFAAGTTLKERFLDDSFYTVDPLEDGELEEGSLGWNNESISLVANNLKGLIEPIESEKEAKSIFFSGMNFSDDDLQVTSEALDSLKEVSNTFGVFLKHSSSQLTEDIFTERRSKGEQVFGTAYLGLQEGSFPGFQIINIFYKAIGGNLSSESGLYESSSKEFEIPNENPEEDPEKITLTGIDPDILIRQCQYTVSEFSGASNSDSDGDGKVTLIDRIYNLYNNFDRNNQLINDRFYGFFGDFGAEMRYWRKVCPHGQTYKLTGRISSATADVAGNYLLNVIPVWFDTRTRQRYEPSSTPIKVYVENSVRTNVSYAEANDSVYEFNGRLFYPSYITKLNISPVISLSDVDEVTAWYRLSRSAASRLVEEANDEWKDQPVLFCRSNLGEVDPSAEPVGAYRVPPLFSGVQNQFESQYTPSFFKISQLVEYIGDHVYNIDFEEPDSVTVETGGEQAIIFQTSGSLPETAGGVGSETVPVSFYEIEFDAEVQGDSDDHSKYELEVLYKPAGQDNFVQIYKFYSAVCFDVTQEEPPYSGKIRFSASDPLRFYCRPAPTSYMGENVEYLTGRLFHIDMPYREVPKFRYAFKFDPSLWEVKLFVNGKRQSVLIINNAGSFGNFNSEFSQINPFTGQILFRDRVDTNKNSVSVEFSHKNDLKIGSQLAVRVVSGPTLGGVTISNPTVNFYSSPSLERVEGEYSSTLYGDHYHLICPTRGFVSLSGASWFFQDSAETDDASNFDPGSLQVIGDLTSPFLYFDAFAEPTNLSDKTLKMGNNLYDFPIIDIPHTTIAVPGASNNAPFTEVRTIGYTAPDAETKTRVDSIYDKNMKKLSILYNINNILNMKYSFTKFIDIDTEDDINFDFMNKRLRRTIPIYTGPLSLVEKEFSSDYTFDIEEPGKIAVGLKINTVGQQSDDLELENGVFLLEASSGSGYESFGYTDGSGEKYPLLIPVYNEAKDGGVGYIQLPYSEGISSLKLIPKEGTNTQQIQKISVQYVEDNKLINGVSGDISLFNSGDYCIFFYSTPDSNLALNQVVAIMSSKDGQYWKRPGVTDLQSTESYKAIPILSNYSNPLVVNNEGSDMLLLFVFGSQDNSVNLIHVSRSIFMKLAKGNATETEYEAPETEVTEGEEPVDPENSRTAMATDEKKDSWAEYFGGTGNHILPIVFNSTEIFSADISERGTIYFVSKSLDNEMRIKINFCEGGTEYSSGGWFDIGIDLFDENGFLSKTLKNEIIYAITLSYDSSMEGLHLFISTMNKLFVYRIPGALLREKNLQETEIDIRVNEYLQDLANEIKPTLVVGNTLDLSEDNTNLEGLALEEEFIPQQVSANWTEDGQSWVFFLGSNGTLRCVKSTSDGNTWKLDENV